MYMRLKIGTRPSLLALQQAKEIERYLPSIFFDIVAITTKGDKDKVTPLTEFQNTDFFTYEIEEALIKKKIDVAVHSAKDLEENPRKELRIVAILKSISRFDCLVSSQGHTLDTLTRGSRIGTSSRARREGILRYRSDLTVKDIRGNVEERIWQLDRGDFEAIIVAEAALIRLGLQNRVSQRIPFDIIKPHPLQGRLALQIRKDRNDLYEIFRRIDGQ